VVWVIFRTTEGLIQIYYKKHYLNLLNLSKEYVSNTSVKKDVLTERAYAILKKKNFIFKISQVFFSIGTFAYSLLFALYGVVPIVIGWFGIIISIVYGSGNLATLYKPKFKILWSIGGLCVLIYEIILGGWLLFFTPFFT